MNATIVTFESLIWPLKLKGLKVLIPKLKNDRRYSHIPKTEDFVSKILKRKLIFDKVKVSRWRCEPCTVFIYRLRFLNVHSLKNPKLNLIWPLSRKRRMETLFYCSKDIAAHFFIGRVKYLISKKF